MKGTQERGFILGTVEDIVLSLDDNAMNLQSMSASRFVGPFFEKVQKWEKSLSHISEVVDVRRDGERDGERGVREEKIGYVASFFLRCGWWSRGSGCIWRVYSLEETLELSYLKKLRSLIILTRHLKK